MKINVEIECTPEEARRAAGLPDLTPLHDRYIAMMTEVMEAGVRPEAMDALMRSWGPVGDAGVSVWRKMFEAAAAGARVGG